MFLDTGVLIDILRYKKGTKEFDIIFKHIENEELYISIFQTVEISNWALKNNISPAEPIQFIKNIVNILPLNEDICQNTVFIKNDLQKKGVKKFGLADGIILASARVIDQRLLTNNRNLKNINDAVVI